MELSGRCSGVYFAFRGLCLRLGFILLVTLFVSAAFTAAHAQATPPPGYLEKLAEMERARRVESLKNLIGRASGVAPEFAADILLRIAASGRIDAAKKAELIEEAFLHAYAVREPVRRRYIGPADGKTHAYYLSNAYDFGFDRLSLQGRVVEAMLGVDRGRAREMFQEMGRPQLPPLSCSDAMVYEVQDFYYNLRSLLQRGFTPDEMKRGEHVRFLEPYVAGVQSVFQVRPVVDLLAAAPLTAEQFELLLGLFVNALQNVPSEPRAVNALDAGPGIVQLAQTRYRKQGVSCYGLLMAWRQFVVRQMRAPRCEDANRTAEEQQLRMLNASFASFESGGDVPIPPIQPEEIDRSSTAGRWASDPLWESAMAKQLFTRLGELRTRPHASVGMQAEWNARFEEFVGQLENWGGHDEKSDLLYFHQKATLFEAALTMLPDGPISSNFESRTRTRVLQDFTTFLSQSHVRQSSPMEWFLYAHHIIHQGLLSAGERGRADTLAALANSRDPVLWLYADLERELRTR